MKSRRSLCPCYVGCICAYSYLKISPTNNVYFSCTNRFIFREAICMECFWAVKLALSISSTQPSPDKRKGWLLNLMSSFTGIFIFCFICLQLRVHWEHETPNGMHQYFIKVIFLINSLLSLHLYDSAFLNLYQSFKNLKH